ncbi:MAG: hypothetical protein NVS2B3_03340 [Vulcanimicrobiaceae bacterium]
MKTWRSRATRLSLWSRVISVVLVCVLIGSTLYAIEATRFERNASTAVQNAEALESAFGNARAAVEAESELSRRYRSEPTANVLAAHAVRAAAFVDAVRTVGALGDARDRHDADALLRAHRSYADATRRLFVAIDRGAGEGEIALARRHVDPAFRRIERTVGAAANAHAASAAASLGALTQTQRHVIAVQAILSAIGLAGLGVFLVILSIYRRRLLATYRAELKKVEEAALVDNLTGIGNHRAYQEDFHREVSRAQRYGQTLSLALLDIDDFKVVNDRDGHLQGDRVLTTIATLLDSLRIVDRAYRIGGDEFAVILPHTSLENAMELLQRLRAEVQAMAFGSTVSIGLATLAGAKCDGETLRAQADAAMYAAKRAGRNSVTAFDASLDGMWLLSAPKIRNLRQMIADGSIGIAFQPIWDVERCKVLAYEALARPHPKYGFGGPQEAFDLAERIGRAHELDRVCREATLARASELPADALLFLNVSPQSLDHGRLDPIDFARAVTAAGLTPERIVVEITERSITRVDAVISAARALQKSGFRLALDDTGAGNSGLEILSRLTLEFVKIDRDVVVKALTDKNARGVLAGIVAIAAAIDAYVIAEGIEDRELLDFVCVAERQSRRRGINGVQGYLLRSPAEAFPKAAETADIEAMLQEFAVGATRTP